MRETRERTFSLPAAAACSGRSAVLRRGRTADEAGRRPTRARRTAAGEGAAAAADVGAAVAAGEAAQVRRGVCAHAVRPCASRAQMHCPHSGVAVLAHAAATLTCRRGRRRTQGSGRPRRAPTSWMTATRASPTRTSSVRRRTPATCVPSPLVRRPSASESAAGAGFTGPLGGGASGREPRAGNNARVQRGIPPTQWRPHRTERERPTTDACAGDQSAYQVLLAQLQQSSSELAPALRQVGWLPLMKRVLGFGGPTFGYYDG